MYKIPSAYRASLCLSFAFCVAGCDPSSVLPGASTGTDGTDEDSAGTASTSSGPEKPEDDTGTSAGEPEKPGDGTSAGTEGGETDSSTSAGGGDTGTSSAGGDTGTSSAGSDTDTSSAGGDTGTTSAGSDTGTSSAGSDTETTSAGSDTGTTSAGDDTDTSDPGDDTDTSDPGDDTDTSEPEPAEPRIVGSLVTAAGATHPNVMVAGWWRGDELLGMTQVFAGQFQAPPDLLEPGEYVVHLMHGDVSLTYPGTFAFATLGEDKQLDMGEVLLPSVPRARTYKPGEISSVEAQGLEVQIDIAGIGNVSDESAVPSLMLHRISLGALPIDKLSVHQRPPKSPELVSAWTPYPEAWMVESGSFKVALSGTFGLEEGQAVQLLGFVAPWFLRDEDEKGTGMFRQLSTGVVTKEGIELEQNEFSVDMSPLFLTKAP